MLWATGEPKVMELFEELKKCTGVRLVL
jgi:hypothetical protein